MTVHGEEGGVPHMTLGDPPEPEQRINHIWALIAVEEDGGEGIYGSSFGQLPVPVPAVTNSDGVKDAMEDHLRHRGSVQVSKRNKTRLEWRKFEWHGERQEIT